jgi:DNA-binding NarL/FixJ family response regulator
MVENIRILIADDHAILRALFATEPDFELVGEAADGQEAVDKSRATVPSCG